MAKKIILGTLLVALVAVLVVGAVNRTNAKAGEAAGEAGRRGRSTENVQVNPAPLALQENVAAQGAGGGWGGGQGRGVSEQGGGYGRSAEVEPGTLGVPEADVQPEEWVALQGTVVSAADDLVEIETAAGEVIPFEGRPLSYALEQGFQLQVGDAVSMAGFDEDGEFKLGRVTNLETKASVTLRDTSGRPGWSGRGRRG